MLDSRATENEITAHAVTCVGRTRSHLQAAGRRANTATTAQELSGTLNGLAVACQAQPVDGAIDLSGRIARMTDAQWWKRGLRRNILRENETIEHAAGHIRRRGQCYVSDHAVHAMARRGKANRETLQALEVVNEDGQALNLSEVADASVSNPKLRRAELMVRCRGFEETAAYMKHEAVFFTLTCPSRFHRFNAAGQPNEKWTDETPRDAQQYLRRVFERTRAEWARAGFTPYGFRVAEPHHDGCPHWHILLFMPPEQAGWFVARRFVADRNDSGAGIIGIFGRQALSDSAGERGAIRHRFTAKRIDPGKGTATGYIAKYICKNIDGLREDGEGVGLDFASGTAADKAAVRVRAWASVWGIRQFQQVGGPSVTVWRELRRLGEGQAQQMDMFEGPRAAADRSLWSLFWVLQGGPEVKRKDLTLRPLWTVDGTGKYGDNVARVLGVQGRDYDTQAEHAIVTKMHTWTVQRAGLADVDAQMYEGREGRASAARQLAFVQAAGYRDVSEFLGHGATVTPWTGVNNCTDGFDLSGFEASDPAQWAHLATKGPPGDVQTMFEDLWAAQDTQAAIEARWSRENSRGRGGYHQ